MISDLELEIWITYKPNTYLVYEIILKSKSVHRASCFFYLLNQIWRDREKKKKKSQQTKHHRRVEEFLKKKPNIIKINQSIKKE